MEIYFWSEGDSNSSPPYQGCYFVYDVSETGTKKKKKIKMLIKKKCIYFHWRRHSQAPRAIDVRAEIIREKSDSVTLFCINSPGFHRVGRRTDQQTRILSDRYILKWERGWKMPTRVIVVVAVKAFCCRYLYHVNIKVLDWPLRRNNFLALSCNRYISFFQMSFKSRHDQTMEK